MVTVIEYDESSINANAKIWLEHLTKSNTAMVDYFTHFVIEKS